jgi:hypothetical protein
MRLEHELSFLKKRKREIRGNNFEDILKLLTKNRVLKDLEDRRNEFGSRLENVFEDLEVADQKETNCLMCGLAPRLWLAVVRHRFLCGLLIYFLLYSSSFSFVSIVCSFVVMSSLCNHYVQFLI